MDLLRFATAGSVDDGKSTLIGRLLYDSKSILEDQLAAVERTSAARGDDYLNLALLTDGLRAEREQGITIDVAYRYFSTPTRAFIVADTPGHVEYTRNMVTGASTADLAIVLVDARKGLLEQTRRHAFVAALLRVPNLVLAVNKMDAVDYSQRVFEEIATEFRELARRLEAPAPTAVPISALKGDNVVSRSATMPWYRGPSLLEHLERVPTAADGARPEVRLPVQYVIDPGTADGGGMRLAGTLASGTLRTGAEVLLLPSGRRSTVVALETPDGAVAEVTAPRAVSVQLQGAPDAARGDLIVSPEGRPEVGRHLSAVLCWMSRRPLVPGRTLTLQHTTRSVPAVVEALAYRIDVNTLERDPQADKLALNDLGAVRLTVREPLAYDRYRAHRSTGSFVLIDDTTDETAGAGMITGG